MDRRRIVIAGVGRSGTSFLFEEVAAALSSAGAARFFYEPYLWAPAKVNRTGRVATEPFDTRNLSPFGIHVHCASPLFLDGPHPVHDQMLHHLLDHDTHVMAKLIRGNGRLKAYLAHDPDLRVVGMLRDVMGTVNSAANHFSFFGEEFHPTDRPRFFDEVIHTFGAQVTRPRAPEAVRQAVMAAAWWQYMTRALLEAQRAFPDRVCLVDYTSLRADPDAAYGRIDAFLDLQVGACRLKKRVGIVSSANYLGETDPAVLEPFHDWGRQTIGAADPADIAVHKTSAFLAPLDEVVARYDRNVPGVVAPYPLFRTVVGWRYALARRDTVATDLTGLVNQTLHTALQARPDLAAPARGAARPQVSVVVPVWNAKDTLEATLASIWGQSGVETEVVLVDDLSQDGSRDLADALLKKGPGRLICNRRNLGPGLSRHRGMLQSRFDLVSTLDADDVALPLKLAGETAALEGQTGRVAFSDVVYRRDGAVERWSFDDIAGVDRRPAMMLIAGRKTAIPRDMTFHRQLYHRTRGFDAAIRMYEDWAFKVELASFASNWVQSGELGVLYDHKHVGLSAGEPAKHRFFLHAAFLKNAEMLATIFGLETVALLERSLAQFGLPDYAARGLAQLRRRARFSGHLLDDFRILRQAANAQMFKPHLTYERRLQACYDRLGAVEPDREDAA